MTLEYSLIGIAGAILAAWLVKEARHRAHLRKAESLPQEGTVLAELGVRARLRDFYRLAVTMEEESVAMYTRLSSVSSNPAVQRLCAALAGEEAVHKSVFLSRLGKWHHIAPNPAEWPVFLQHVKKAGLFDDIPGENATEAETIRFAIDFEAKTAAYYAHFEKAFPDAWRQAKMAELVKEELVHAARLRAAYPAP